MPLRSRFAALLGLLLVLALAGPASAAAPSARWAADAKASDGRLIVVWKQAPPSTLRTALSSSFPKTCPPS